MSPCMVDSMVKEKSQSWWGWICSWFVTAHSPPEPEKMPEQPAIRPGYLPKNEAMQLAFEQSASCSRATFRVLCDGEYATVEKVDNLSGHMQPVGVQVVDFARIGSTACASCPYCGAAILPDTTTVAIERPIIKIGSEADRLFKAAKAKAEEDLKARESASLNLPSN